MQVELILDGALFSADVVARTAQRFTGECFVDVSSEPLFGPDTLRLATALNYSLLGLSGMAVLSLAILSISVVVLRTQVLARWVGYVGLGCGLPMLASVIAQYGAFTTPLAILWALCLAVAIWRQPAADPS